MSSNGSRNGKVPRAGTNPFAAVFASRGKGAAVIALNASLARRVVHEKESSLPITLVDGLAPLHAADGDDDLMSEPPANNAPKGKPARLQSGSA